MRARPRLIQHVAEAKNPTFCDGLAVESGGAALREGSVVTLGPERMRLTVHLEV